MSKSKNRKSTYTPRHMRRYHTYTVGEVAETINTLPVTIRKWIRQGLLKTIDGRRPWLIHGSDLQACCELKNARRKKQGLPGEMHCTSCRAPKPAKVNSVNVSRKYERRPRIFAQCVDCGGTMHEISSTTKLAEKMNTIIARSKGVYRPTQGRKAKRVSYRELSDMITEYNKVNERLKHLYFEHLLEAMERSPKTIQQVETALLRFERWFGFKNYTFFTKDIAIQYKKYLKTQKLSLYTIQQSCCFLQAFLTWLRQQVGYKRKISQMAIEYLNLSQGDKRAAKARRMRRYPSFEQIEQAVKAMPTELPREKRDRAMICFLALTGIRDGAMVKLQVKHIDIQNRLLTQDPCEVPTKYGQYIVTRFFPVQGIFLDIFSEYYEELRKEHFLGPSDPLFPKMETFTNEHLEYEAGGYSKDFLTNAAMLQRIAKQAFENIGIEGFTPHQIRHSLSYMGKQRADTPEKLKAWSQNLGHTTVRHIMDTYGQLDTRRQIEIMGQF